MSTVNLKDARKRLSSIVAAVERGESIVITRRGKKVARLVPMRDKPLLGLPDLTEFRASLRIRGRSLTEELLALRREERS
jgi:prevent-host-death family protein